MAARSNKLSRLERSLSNANKRAREANAVDGHQAFGALGAGMLAGELEIRGMRLPGPIPIPNSLAIALGSWGLQVWTKPSAKMKRLLTGATAGALGLYGYGLRRELGDSGHTIADYDDPDAFIGEDDDFEAEG